LRKGAKTEAEFIGVRPEREQPAGLPDCFDVAAFVSAAERGDYQTCQRIIQEARNG
jgi:hypothetical protein